MLLLAYLFCDMFYIAAATVYGAMAEVIFGRSVVETEVNKVLTPLVEAGYAADQKEGGPCWLLRTSVEKFAVCISPIFLFTWMTWRDFSSMIKKAKSKRKKRSGTCKKIAGPHPCRMITQKRLPVLSPRCCAASLVHVFLNGPFTHSDIQL